MHRIAKWSLIASVLMLLIVHTASGVIDLDLWHELALAREIIQLGQVPWQDHFAYTPKLDLVVHHEWGAGLLAYLATEALGAAGLLILKFSLIIGLAIVCWCNARRRGASVIATGLIAVLAIWLRDYSFGTVRAQMYSYLLTALLLWGFDRDRKGDRHWLIGLFVLFPVWVNLHGGCLVGAALLGGHWLEQWLRRQPHQHLLIAGLLLIPLATLNPWGWHYHAYLVRAMTMPRPLIPEWNPVWAEWPHLIRFGVSAGVGWLVLHGGRWRQMPGILLLVATGLAGVKSNRFLAFYAIVCTCYLPTQLDHAELGKTLRRIWWKYQRAVCGGCVSCSLLMLGRLVAEEPWRVRVPGHREKESAFHLTYPVGAVNYLAEQRFRGNVFVPYNFGSYLMWKLGPAVQISFDSRYEVAYPTWRLEEDEAFFEARDGWNRTLAKYPTDIVLVLVNMEVVKKLADLPNWKLVYRDSQFAMFARSELSLPVLITDSVPPEGHYP